MILKCDLKCVYLWLVNFAPIKKKNHNGKEYEKEYVYICV